MMRFFVILISVLLGLFLWETVSQSHAHWQLVLPAPSTIVIRLYSHADRFFLHTLATLKEIVGGLVLAIFMAFPLAWLMMRFSSLRSVLQPVLVMMQALPMFALAPLMILWFDWSYTAVVIPTALMIFFPLTVAIYRGFASTPIQLLDYFRLHAATEAQVFIKLHLPWAMPHICSGLRISAAIASMGAVSGEFAGAQEGLGVLMVESRRGADFTTTFAALFCLMGLSLALYIFSLIVEKGVLRSHRFSPLVIAGIACMVLFSGCSQDVRSSNELRLMLDWFPNPNHVPIYVGVKKGFFREQGWNIRVLKLQDAAEVFPYLGSGQADLGIAYMPHLVEAQRRGMDIRPAAYLIKQPLMGFIFRKEAGIQTIQDLNGKRISFMPDDLLDSSLTRLMATNGITPGARLRVGFDLVTALVIDKVDVLYGAYWNIEGEQLKSLGIETDHFGVAELGMPPYFELILVATGAFLDQRPEIERSLKTALDRSIAFCRDHPEEAFQIYLEANPDKSLTTQDWERRSWELTRPLLAETQEDEPEVWNRYLEWFNGSGSGREM